MATEAGQPLRNNMVELNNWRKPMAQNINQIIGPKQVAQANDATTDYSGNLIAGKQSIRPTVIPWPYAADDDGAAFDQSNLWGVRFNAYNPEQNAVIAVPKRLPSGYTATVSRGGWQCVQNPFLGQPPDYTSADSGVTWSNNGDIFSVPNTRYYLRAPPGNDQLTKDWGPMNWANKSGLGGGIDYYTFDYVAPTPFIKMSFIANDHIGFRRIRLVYYTDTTRVIFPTIYVGYKVAGVALTGYPDLPTVLYSHTVTAGELVPTGVFTAATATYLLSNIQGPTLGQRYDFYIWQDSTASGLSPTESWATTLSPRTDVPFPFDVVGLGNGTASDWHAPGGFAP